MTDKDRGNSPESSKKQETERKPYRSPKLKDLGELRGVTMGGSPGAGDTADAQNDSPVQL